MITCDECKNNTGKKCIYEQDEYGTLASSGCDWFDPTFEEDKKGPNIVSTKILCLRCKFSVNDTCEKKRHHYGTKKAKKCHDFIMKLPDATLPALFQGPVTLPPAEPIHKVAPTSPRKIEQDDICLLMYAL